MYCKRFNKDVKLTHHASERMLQRKISDQELLELLETGDIRYKDEVRCWIAKALPNRQDNLVCAAVILEDQLVVKTIMHHFVWEEES